MKQNCTKKPLSELLTQHTDVEKVSDVKKERYITLSSYGNGAHERVIKDGKYPVPFSGYRVSAGQFIYSRIDARNGAYDIIPSELDGCVVSKDFPVFDVDTSLVLPRFLLKSVLSSNFIEQVRLSSFGATNRMRIKEDVFGSYLINIPPLEEQAKIVECLDKVQSIIDLRRSEINRMDELIKARFVEMFGDPESNSFGWNKQELKKHADVMTGYAFPSEGYSDTGIDIVGGYNLMQGFIQWSESKHWPEEKGYEQFLLKPNDIVMAMDRPWVNGGFKIARIDAEHLPALLIQRTACIRGKDVVQEFLYALLDTPRFAEHCNITGSLVPHISNKDINSFMIIVPPEEKQKEFADFVNQVDKSKSVVQNSLDEAQLLFSSLMQKYFG